MSYIKHLESLENKFARLDELPELLYSSIVTHSHGQLTERIQGILQWRDALLAGRLPDEKNLTWPDTILRRMVLKRLEVLEIVQYCRQQPELTDAILIDVCEAITSAEQWQEFDPGFDDTLARQQKYRHRDSPFSDPNKQNRQKQSPEQQTSEQLLPEEQTTRQNSTPQVSSQSSTQYSSEHKSPEQNNSESLSYNPGNERSNNRADAIGYSLSGHKSLSKLINVQDDSLSEQIDKKDQITNHSVLEEHWLELSQQWQQLASAFSDISGFLGRGWDLTPGLLASQGWRDIVRYRKLVKDLPWLEQVIASMGRLKEIASDEPQSVIEQVFEPVKRLIEEEKEIRSPLTVHETSGIRRSDDISRLLPGELAQLGHPQMNLLWHAKRAEHALMTYQVEGVLSEHEPVEREILEQVKRTKPQSEEGYGPIIVCLDCSASMQGEAENIAKALVLEAMRIAWYEKRACYVYSFSGPGQILDHNLDLTQGGLAKLLSFLTQTFHGGTDVIEPLIQALSRQQQEKWQNSDLLLVTDGRFPINHEQKQKVRNTRQCSKTRIHGVLIGQWQGNAIQTVCDNFHRIKLSSIP